ncbi:MULTISPECIES: hypothetical protein [unclassified Streptomyces]|uniref:hypothetical protein n=1 Tax=Streptomyces sp. NPDC004658 TaxID=3154672 RepID=UPI0021AD3E74|nr:hypothetical protein [Streptomyces sp. F12]
MASTARRSRPPNADLARLIEACGASKKSLPLRVNQLAHQAGMETDYSHTSIANWCQRGMIPKWPVPNLLAQAIGERLGRPVDLSDIGMGEAETPDADVGLDFPRDRADAVRVATSFWSSVNRRDFLTGSGFAVSAFTTPVTRWLSPPPTRPPTTPAASRSAAPTSTSCGTPPTRPAAGTPSTAAGTGRPTPSPPA